MKIKFLYVVSEILIIVDQQEDIEIVNVKKQPCSYRYKTILSSNILGVTLPPFICGILRVNPKTGLYQLTDDQNTV